jgi:Mlc titration factor MtfA (ptsG expression regulator)
MSRLDLIIRSLFRQSKFANTFFSDNEIVVQKELEWYSELISKYFEYFNELSVPQKQRFLRRVHSFKHKKEFHYIGLEASPQVPVLICAAAVQLTFGLRKYKMSFFRHIYIMADEYTYGLSSQPWIGHVNRKGIFISWKHFLHGYSVNSDRHNVGLHEMAHALVYANFLGGFSAEQHFVDYFEKYQTKTNGLMREEKWRICNLFSEQAINNFQECWAECAELFFENPSELNQHYPELYDAIKVILNQDPLNKIKILSPNVASGYS